MLRVAWRFIISKNKLVKTVTGPHSRMFSERTRVRREEIELLRIIDNIIKTAMALTGGDRLRRKKALQVKKVCRLDDA